MQKNIKKLIAIIFLSGLLFGYKESISQVVIPISVLSQGAVSSTGNGVLLSGTVGQTAINVVAGVGVNDNQGFWYAGRSYQGSITSVKEEHEENLGEVSGGLAIVSYPNPFSTETNILISLEKSGEVSLKLYNSLGKEVKSLIEGYRASGKINVYLTSDELENGIYTAVLVANGNSRKTRVVVIK